MVDPRFGDGLERKGCLQPYSVSPESGIVPASLRRVKLPVYMRLCLLMGELMLPGYPETVVYNNRDQRRYLSRPVAVEARSIVLHTQLLLFWASGALTW